MMKILQCPKCRSDQIVRLPEDVQPSPVLSGAKSPASHKAIKATRYCCANCGYSEVWVDNPEDLKDLLRKFGF
jgi:predicted nucleic-acid-binding Zn-ribbon protein